MSGRILPLLALASALGGCRIERHLLADPGESQAVRVEAGDRFYFDLEERSGEGYRWDCVCADEDVEVLIDHDFEEGEAEVRVRIHRGFDGPTNVRFLYRSARDVKPVKSFDLTLYKIAGDRAVWE